MARSGAWLQLVRGIYVDNDGTIETAITAHAVRIAHYLYPKAYLSSASAVHIGPTQDGRLFISGRRNQRTRLRNLEIVQNLAIGRPSIETTVIRDGLGEFAINISDLRQLVLEAFRLRSEHASAMTAEMRSQIGLRLIEEYGSPKAAAEAVSVLALENNFQREGEFAERYLLGIRATPHPQKSKAKFPKLIVAWHRDVIGTLSYDGIEWQWAPKPGYGPHLARKTEPGKLPVFIESLLPEGWLATILAEKDAWASLQHGRRYLSNFSILGSNKNLGVIPADVLEADLSKFTNSAWFTGRFERPPLGSQQTDFGADLVGIVRKSETPRLSGGQIKAPMCLGADGHLVPAVGRPFTHILKLAGSGAYETQPIVEWLCLSFACIAGIEVPKTAIVSMPGLMAPALLVERFDIRSGPDDQRRLMLENFCSVLNQPAAAKYDGSIEGIAEGLRSLSTDPEADIITLFRRALFAWLIGDGHMHLKNIALLKIADANAPSFKSVRLAPIYGTVTTRLYPGHDLDRVSLKVNDKQSDLKYRDFIALARRIGIPEDIATSEMAEMPARLADFSVPPMLISPVTDVDLAESLRARIEETILIRAGKLKLG
jgi:serine/threonine-protein kinase HipA